MLAHSLFLPHMHVQANVVSPRRFSVKQWHLPCDGFTALVSYQGLATGGKQKAYNELAFSGCFVEVFFHETGFL